MRRRKTIPLVPPDRAIDGMRQRNPFGHDRPFVMPPAARRLYQIRDLMVTGSDGPVRVIGSVGGDGKIRDRYGAPYKVFTPSPAGKGGAA